MTRAYPLWARGRGWGSLSEHPTIFCLHHSHCQRKGRLSRTQSLRRELEQGVWVGGSGWGGAWQRGGFRLAVWRGRVLGFSSKSQRPQVRSTSTPVGIDGRKEFRIQSTASLIFPWGWGEAVSIHLNLPGETNTTLV